MPSITAGGIGSGLDVNGLVSQLMAAESGPPTLRLDRREVGFQAKLSALGSLKSVLSEFQSTQKELSNVAGYRSKLVESSDEDLFTASGGTSALVGEYNVEVTHLAKSQKFASKAFTNSTDAVGAGTLKFRFGTYDSVANTFTTNPDKGAQSVIIDSTNNSLQGIRDAVNNVDIGVRASIVDDGTGKRLVLSSASTGTENSLQITVSGDGDSVDTDDAGLSQLAYDPTASGVGTGKNLTETLAAEDATLTVDGLAITRPSNTVTDVIEGVTLELESATAGATATLTVTNNTGAITAAASNFIESYNTLISALDSLTSYDAETGAAGELLGDATVRGIESQVRRLLSSTIDGVSGAYQSLADIGITTQRDGTLTLDSGDLQTAIDENAVAVTQLFASVGEADDALITFSAFTDESVAGEYDVNITQLATQGTYTGAATAGFPLTIDGDNDTFSIKVDGLQSGSIILTQGDYASGSSLAAEIQSRINGDNTLSDGSKGVVVNYTNGAFELVSASYGSESTVEISALDTNTTADLGLSVGVGVDGVDVKGTLGGVSASGSGQTLTGFGRVSGLAINVIGGALGERGTVSFANGVAAQLSDLMDAMLGSDNTLDSRIDVLNDQVSDIGDQREALDRRLEAIEERYRAQFAVLDSLLGQLQTTSTFLTQQLASLPGPRTGQ